MIATMNTFPPLHALNSPRSWFLALIVLLHAAFFWALTHGVTTWIVEAPPPPFVVVDVPQRLVDPPSTPMPVEPTIRRIYVPVVPEPRLRHDDTKEPIQVTSDPQPVPRDVVVDKPGSGPLVVEPALDPRFPFTEPEYPVSEIRLGHQGTVLLALQILPSGRVGAVRIEQSSGYAKLDESAARQARGWRMKPGSSDGTAMAMWKLVPIKFQLKN